MQVEQEKVSGPLMTFTEGARQAMEFSLEETQRFNHTIIGTEHLLLGLTREETAREAMQNVGLEPNKIRDIVKSLIQPGDSSPTDIIKMGPDFNLVIEYAVREGEIDGANQITSVHLLKGIFEAESETLDKVVNGLGLDPDVLKLKLRNYQPPANK